MFSDKTYKILIVESYEAENRYLLFEENYSFQIEPFKCFIHYIKTNFLNYILKYILKFIKNLI